MQTKDESAHQRILIVEANWLGDVLFSTPAIRAVRKKYPGAYIAALVVSRCKDVLRGNNYLDEVIVLDEPGRHKGFWGKLHLIRDLRVRRFTIAYFLRPSLTRTIWVFLAGVKTRIGYDVKNKSFLLTHKVTPCAEAVHRADTYYYLIAKTKIPDDEYYCDFFITAEDKKYVDGLLEKHEFYPEKKLIVLHVGGNWSLKLWPKKNFASLTDALIEYYQANVVISGSFLDLARAKEIVKMARHKPLMACGLTTLKQLGALFQKSDLVISADSGPLHIAMAMKARTVALFGPTSPQMTGPLSKGDDFSILRRTDTACIIPCYNLECKDNVCMSSISVQQILDEVERSGWLKRAG